MNENIKPYDEYKFCEYAGNIPKHWSVDRISTLFMENKTLNVEIKETNALQFKFGEIIQKKQMKLDEGLKVTLSKYTVVNPMDIVINGLNLNYDFVTQRVGLVKFNGVITSSYITLTPRDNVNSRYFSLLLKSYDTRKIFNGMGSGIRLTLDYSELKKLQLPVPPQSEQNQIVHYLDNKISKINKLIKAKKKQVLLLKEQKQAIIDNAIIKGVNEKTVMKYSGIEWIGNIPESWEVRRIKSVANVSPTINQLVNERSLDDKVVFLPMDKISSDGDIDNSEWRKIKDVKTGFTSFAKNDVVVAKITPCFENGKGACLDKLESDFGYGTTELIVLRASEKINPKYLYYITRISQFRILGEKDMTGSAGQKRVPTGFVGNFSLGIPKIEEQIQIIEYIEKKKVQIENVIQRIARELELISEYKNSLIFSVVTGKVDIRDIQINEEIDEVDTEESEECECDSDLNEIEGDE